MVKNKRIHILAESAVMLALATVLSMIHLWKMPFGGSLTPLSMLPICMVGLRHGPRWGFGCAFTYSVIQLALDLASVLSWGLTPVVLIACIFLDYIFAFTALGICGLFNRAADKKHLRIKMCIGVALALFARFVCHYISGVTLWTESAVAEGYSPYIYSALYNGSFMLPELILTEVAVIVLMTVPQFRRLLNMDEE